MWSGDIETMLKTLESEVLFSRVGEHDPNAKVLKSWRDAYERKTSNRGTNFFKSRYSDVWSTVLKVMSEKQQYEWFDARKILNKRLDLLASLHPAFNTPRESLSPEDFTFLWEQIRNDLGMAMMEVQYKKELGSGYESVFKDVFSWYERGRVFCGWEGKYPEGKAIIF